MQAVNGNYIGSLISDASTNLKGQEFKSFGAEIKALAENPEQNLQEIESAAKKFEGMFISQLLGFMYNTVEVDEVFGGGFGEETFRGLLVDEYGKIISQSSGIGIADDIQKKLLEMQAQEVNKNSQI